MESVLLQPPEAPSSHNNPPTPLLPRPETGSMSKPQTSPQPPFPRRKRKFSVPRGTPISPLPCPLGHMPPRLQSSVPSFQGEQGTRGEGEGAHKREGGAEALLKSAQTGNS